MKHEIDLGTELEPTEQKQWKAVPAQLIALENGVVLRRGRAQLQVEGEVGAEVVEEIFAATTGQTASSEQLEQLFGAPLRPTVRELLQTLIEKRFLLPADEAAPSDDVESGGESSLDVFYWHFGGTAQKAARGLEQKRIAVLGVNSIARQLLSSLRAAGVRNVASVDHPLLRNVRLFDDAGQLCDERWPGGAPLPYDEWIDDTETLDCLVATSDFGEQRLLRQLNEFCVRFGHDFLPVVLQDMIGYVGPLIVPGETACFECLRARQNANLRDAATERIAETVAFEGQFVNAFHPAMASMLGDLAALELTKFYSGALPNPRVATLLELNALNTELHARKVLKVPRCKVCSSLYRQPAASTDTNTFLPGNREEA